MEKPEVLKFIWVCGGCEGGEEGGNSQNLSALFLFWENPALSESWWEVGPRLPLQKPMGPDTPSPAIITT